MKPKQVFSVILIVIAFAIAFLSIFIFWPRPPEESPYVGQRRALILCSANDFYGSGNDVFGDANDCNFTTSWGHWVPIPSPGDNPGWNGGPGASTDGYIYFNTTVNDYTNANFTYDWNRYQGLEEYAYYNMSASIRIIGGDAPTGGVRVGLQWLNSIGQVVKTDWSENVTFSGPIWYNVSVAGVCNNDTGNEIANLTLIMSAKASFMPGPSHEIQFDDIRMDKWIQVNLTDPTTPPPPPLNKSNSDGFPAQALQVYKILKKHGYTDDNILLMLYYKDDADGIIDIDKNDGIANDLVGAVIDIANNSVTSTRFKQELNVSISGSFASKIHLEDQVIIYMTDHGSNKVLADGNATFHFESDGKTITELEFYNLVKEIDCTRLLINVDCCFSGNFLSYNSSIGQAWYDIPNSILVSSSSNRLSWYWVNNNNGDGWAGSWFFHVFWDQLDQGQTIQNAYNFAIGFMPAVIPPAPLVQIQNPLMKDNLGVANSWSFSSTPQL